MSPIWCGRYGNGCESPHVECFTGNAMWIYFQVRHVDAVSSPLKFLRWFRRLSLQLACAAAKLEGYCLGLELGAKRSKPWMMDLCGPPFTPPTPSINQVCRLWCFLPLILTSWSQIMQHGTVSGDVGYICAPTCKFNSALCVSFCPHLWCCSGCPSCYCNLDRSYVSPTRHLSRLVFFSFLSPAALAWYYTTDRAMPYSPQCDYLSIILLRQQRGMAGWARLLSNCFGLLQQQLVVSKYSNVIG